MEFILNIFGWIGAGLLLFAYWLVSSKRLEGDSTVYQAINIVGSVFVLVNSYYFGAFPSVAISIFWIVIGVYILSVKR